MSVKRRSWRGRLLYFVNIIFALALLLSYLAYYVPPGLLSLFSFAAIGYPLLFFINLLFVIIWLLRFNRRLFLSLLCIGIGYLHVPRMYQLGKPRRVVNAKDRLKVMSYNVRLFNSYNWLDDEQVEDKIIDLIKAEDPEVLMMQEFQENSLPAMSGLDFPYQHSQMKAWHKSYGMIIFSRYPIKASGVVEIEQDTGHSSQFHYADIEWNDRIIRFINVHLASVGLEKADYEILENPELQDEDNVKDGVQVIVSRLDGAFKRRNLQIEAVKKAVTESPHPVVLCGDFNDVPQSYAYHRINLELEDSFMEGGEGFGKTYIRSPLPLRIDYIFHSAELKAFNFHTVKQELSDHYPIVTDLEFQPQTR